MTPQRSPNNSGKKCFLTIFDFSGDRLFYRLRVQEEDLLLVQEEDHPLVQEEDVLLVQEEDRGVIAAATAAATTRSSVGNE